jgi:hypothetical protein
VVKQINNLPSTSFWPGNKPAFQLVEIVRFNFLETVPWHRNWSFGGSMVRPLPGCCGARSRTLPLSTGFGDILALHRWCRPPAIVRRIRAGWVNPV